MNLMQALILGIVQGLTEVLPVSSSAHLILIPRLLNWAESGLTFDVALHVGTLIALCLYFRNDIADMTRNFFRGLLERNFRSVERRLPLYIIAGSIPAALVGKTLEEPIENLFRSNPALIALFLIVFGIVLGIADKWGAQKKELAD